MTSGHFHTTYDMRFAARLFGVEVRWYSLFVVLLFVGGWLFSRHVARHYAFGPDKARVSDGQVDALYLLLIALSVLGARLGQVLFYEPSMILAAPGRVLALHEGGMSSHGVFVGLLTAAFLWARWTGRSVLTALDLLAASLPIYPTLIRLGNFLNSELWGAPTDLPWGVVFFGAGPQPRHPVQLYEMALEGLGSALLLAWAIRRFGFVRPGLLSGVFLVWYAPIRVFCEIFKENQPAPFDLWGLPTASVLSVPMLALGLCFLVRTRKTT